MSEENADEFKGLVKQYIDDNISRRKFLTKLAGIGLSAAAANSIAQEFTPFVTRKGETTPETPSWIKSTQGKGGKLLVEQLKAAGQKYLFINPSSSQAAIFDALVDEPDMHIIKAVQEGALVAIADGYARATGETPFIMISRIGVSNALSMMYNSWKDHIPMVLFVDDVNTNMLGRAGYQTMDHMSSMAQTMTKWHWSINASKKIPEVTRRALKFASTKPSRPVFISCPENYLFEKTTTAIMEQDKFSVPMNVRPDSAEIKRCAKLLLKADNPLILTGDEIRYCQAEPELMELAELLSIPVVNDWTGSWSKPFPDKHPLNLGGYISKSRFPGKVDLMLNLGARMPTAFYKLQIESQVKLIQVRLDAENLAITYPAEMAIFANLKLALIDLLEELKQQSNPRTLKRVTRERLDRAKTYQSQKAEAVQQVIRKNWDKDPISGERILLELENLLPKDAVIVSDGDTYTSHVNRYFTYGPEDKSLFGNTGFTLGWSLPAAFGVKLAMPEKLVVSIVSDGSFLFSGPQPLWTYSRYKAPIIVVVLNNRSYNNVRNRIMSYSSRAYETGQDMVGYLGDPDVNYVKLAEGFDIEGEIVNRPESIKSAIQRALKSIKQGRSYLLDVNIERIGTLANSTWSPEFFITSMQDKRV